MRAATAILLAILIVIAVVGVTLTRDAVENKAATMRSDLMAEANVAALGVNVSHVMGLSGSGADLDSPDYVSLKAQLIDFSEVVPEVRFVYIVGHWPNGTVFIYVDSEAVTSPDYSPPGQVYQEAGSAFDRAFLGHSDINQEPIEDRWGSWITAMAPLVDPTTGETVAVLAADVNSVNWGGQEAMAGLPYALTSLLIATLLIIFTVLRRFKEREEDQLEESARVLRASEAKYRLLIENSHDIIYTMTKEGQLTFVSPSWTRIMGHPVNEVEGKYLHDFIHPDDLDACNAALRQMIESGQGRTDFEYRVKHADGSWRWHTSSATVLRDRSGAIVGVEGVGSDITEKRKAKAELQDSERKYRSVTENAKEGIVVAQDGLVKYANPRAYEMLQLGGENMVDVPLDRFIHPDNKDTVVGRHHRRIRGEEAPSHYDLRLIGSKGHESWVSLSVVPILWDERPATLNFLMDISERKRAEETILRANKKLNLLNSITRHDALNQVTVISGYAALLEEVVRDPEQAEYVRKMRRSALSIQRQMEFTKIYQEIGAHAPTWQSLQESVHKAMGSLNLGDLVIRAQDLDYLIRADPMFEKVVYNLIENCLRHSGGARSMDISTTVEEGVLKLVFQDDGLGTSVEDKARLFERGYGKNTGFGLFLAKEVLGMTGIEIVENGEPGKGARFEITIPKEDWRAA